MLFSSGKIIYSKITCLKKLSLCRKCIFHFEVDFVESVFISIDFCLCSRILNKSHLRLNRIMLDRKNEGHAEMLSR